MFNTTAAARQPRRVDKTIKYLPKIPEKENGCLEDGEPTIHVRPRHFLRIKTLVYVFGQRHENNNQTKQPSCAPGTAFSLPTLSKCHAIFRTLLQGNRFRTVRTGYQYQSSTMRHIINHDTVVSENSNRRCELLVYKPSRCHLT